MSSDPSDPSDPGAFSALPIWARPVVPPPPPVPPPVFLPSQSERRGTPLAAADRRTRLRAEVFRRVADGDALEVVAATCGISPAQVRAVLATERRGRPKPAPDVLEVRS